MALTHFTLQFDPTVARPSWRRLQSLSDAERRAALQARAREVARSAHPWVQRALAMARHDPGALALAADDELAEARLWLVDLIGQARPALSLDDGAGSGGQPWHLQLMQALPKAGWGADETNLLLRGEPLGRCFEPSRACGQTSTGSSGEQASRLDDLAGWLSAAHARTLRARLASVSHEIEPRALERAHEVLAQASGPRKALLVWLD